MRKRAATLGAGLALAASITVPVDAVVIFSDNFESYLNTAQMEAAGAWGDNGSSTSPGTLSTSGGNPGKFMNHPAGVAAQHNIAQIGPTSTAPLVWQFDFFDDGLGNKRVTGGLRHTNGSSLLEMGRYNAAAYMDDAGVNNLGPDANNDNVPDNVSGYAVRTVFVNGVPAGSGGWVTFNGNPSVQSGWHTLTATILPNYTLFELDFGANGTVDTKRLITTSTGEVYNVLRLGGPSDLTSPGGGAGFDNVSLSTFQPIKGIFNTGVGNDSTNVDPHWTVHRPASATAPVAPGQGLPTFVVPDDDFPIPPWAPNTAASRWISSTPDSDGNDTLGFYDYSIDFNLTAAELNYLILGEWASDNRGVNIFINGVGTGQTNPGFAGLVPFQINSGFVVGNNRLTFRVENFSPNNNPTGLRVNFTAFGAIPEPATLALGAVSAFALFGVRRRRGA